MNRVTRREALAFGAATLTLAGWPGAVMAGPAAARPGRPSRFLIDQRLPGAPTLQQWVQRAGHPVLLCGHEVGALAMQLQHEWSSACEPLIGLSLSSTAFIMEQIALRSGLRFTRGDIESTLPADATRWLVTTLRRHHDRTAPPGDPALWWRAAPMPAVGPPETVA